MTLIPILVILSFFCYLAFSLLFVFPIFSAFFITGITFLALLFANILWMFLVFFKSKETDELKFEKPLQKLAFLSMGIISFLWMLTAFRDLFALFDQFLASLHPHFHFEFYSAQITSLIFGSSFVFLILGVIRAKFRLEIKTIPITLSNLPSTFNHFKIVQLSDVHLGTGMTLPHLKTTLAKVKQLKPDLIAFTGDIIDGSIKDIPNELLLLKELTAPFGKYFVLGNHEYYWNAPASIQAMKNAGFHVLINQNHIIEKENQSLVISGVSDPAAKHMNAEVPDLIAAYSCDSRIPASTPRILLCHQPVLAKEASAAGFSLMLSGHTHGGQFIPWSWMIRFAHNFHTGLSKVSDTLQIYVSHGTGYWGPPIRLGTTSEITEIILQTTQKQSGKNS